MGTYLLVAAAGLVAATVTMTVTALAARAQGRVAVVDVAWGLGFVLVGLAAAVVGQVTGEGDTSRRWLLAGLVGVWGLRLAWHIRRKAAHGDEDPRYRKLLGGTLDEVGIGVAVRKVFAVQGVALLFVSLPVLVGAVSGVEWWPVVVVGIVLWALGLVFEAVGDAQLAAYKTDPDRGPVMDRGLWSWTRHPNYFGDACVWWGLWLVGGAGSGWVAALVTLPAPLVMTYFLVFATGARLLEAEMSKRPGYPAYAERTSMFVPLPPRRHRA